jgi:hypothetical protein
VQITHMATYHLPKPEWDYLVQTLQQRGPASGWRW